MDYIIQDISKYAFYILIPMYVLMIINLTQVLFLKKYKNKIMNFVICTLSIIAAGSQLIFEGILLDNLMDIKTIWLQTGIISILLVILWIIILISMIKGKKGNK